MRSIFNNMIKVIYGIFIAILTIGISTIMALNSQFIYHYSINKYSLDKLGNISKEMLIKDFNTLIKYLQNPFIEKLKFNNFPMSINGEFHFYEVKRIFLFIYGITIFIALLFIVLFIVNRIIGKKIYFYKILNYGANTLISVSYTHLLEIPVDF